MCTFSDDDFDASYFSGKYKWLNSKFSHPPHNGGDDQKMIDSVTEERKTSKPQNLNCTCNKACVNYARTC